MEWQGAEILVVTEGGTFIITGHQIFGVELLRLHE
jgi:phage FluMu protein gp41